MCTIKLSKMFSHCDLQGECKLLHDAKLPDFLKEKIAAIDTSSFVTKIAEKIKASIIKAIKVGWFTARGNWFGTRELQEE